MTSVAKLKTVAGVDISKIDPPTFKGAYEKALKKKVEGDVPKLVEELVGHFQKTVKGGEILECENCGGGSPSALFPDHCPFCGETDDDASASPEPTNGVSKAAVPEPPKSEPKTSTKKRTMKEPAPETTAMVPVVKSDLAISERDLDAAVMRMKALRESGASALWQLSVELRAIYDGELWKLRNDENGKPKYKNFAKFLAEEVDLHERTVWRMIAVTKEFNESQAKKFGVSILRGLLAAPKEDREEILEKVSTGTIKGTRGVDREVEKIRKRKGVKVVEGAGKKKTTQGKAAAKASTAAAAKAAEKKKIVTVAVPTGRKTVKLFVRSLKKSDPEKRAKRLADRPWGQLECANGVTMFFAIVENNAGELELSVEARRED